MDSEKSDNCLVNIFYDELKIEKMAKFEILIATNGLRKWGSSPMCHYVGQKCSL